MSTNGKIMLLFAQLAISILLLSDSKPEQPATEPRKVIL